MNNSASGLHACRQNSLKTGFFDFFGNDPHLGLAETSLLDPVVELVFFETEPAVSVKFSGFLETMGAEVEDEQAAAGLEDAKGFLQRQPRVLGVVQGLAE